MLLLFIVLFIPMQWGAPPGNVTQHQFVVEIVPNVCGTIIEVPTAAIYTESARITQIIRKVMVRMEAWMNYIIP